MFPVIWTESAETDLLHITDYVAEHNVSAALKLAQKIRQSVLPLATFPHMFRESEKMPGCREIVAHTNYLVFYRVTESHVEITGVLHGRRQFPC